MREAAGEVVLHFLSVVLLENLNCWYISFCVYIYIGTSLGNADSKAQPYLNEESQAGPFSSEEPLVIFAFEKGNNEKLIQLVTFLEEDGNFSKEKTAIVLA